MQTTAAPLLNISLLGPVKLHRSDKTGVKETRRKTLALLAWLLLEGDQPHTREQLVTLFWPEMNDKSGRNNLRVSLSQIRKHLVEPSMLVADRAEISLHTSPNHSVDVHCFEQLINRVEEHPHTDLAACSSCQAVLREALEMYRAPFLSGLVLNDCEAFEEWAFVWRERLHLMAMTQMSRLIDADIANNQLKSAEEMARRQLKLDSLNELTHRQLMQILSKRGERLRALQQYKICAEILQRELGIPPDAETEHLRQEIEQGRHQPVSGAQEIGPVSEKTEPVLARQRFPRIQTPFFGREEELTILAERLAARAYRLISLVGPGGIGKTRLAQEAGAKAQNGFPDGVFFVSLAGISSHHDISKTILIALGITQRENVHPDSLLLDSLLDKNLLLIVDNFEHLMDGVSLIEDILNAAPNVVVLLTSREQLNLQTEDLFRLKGLPYPAAHDDLHASQYAAVRLFGDRAHRIKKQFWLNEDSLSSVVKICQLVEGLPLALELAATSIREYPIEEIVALLAAEPEILSTDLRDVPLRHRQMASVFDVSWQLLSDEEQTVLAKLSVFRGGFTKTAGREVTGAGAVTLSRLIYKSLVRADGNGRYSMHELIRQFAAGKLARDEGVRAKTEKEHARFYLSTLEQETAPLIHTEPLAAFNRLQRDSDNLREAWKAGFTHQLFPELSQVVAGYTHYHIRLGSSREMIAILQSGIGQLRRLASTREIALLECTLFTFEAHLRSILKDKEAIQLAENSLRLAMDVEDGYLITFNLFNKGWSNLAAGDIDQALYSFSEAETLAREGNFPDLLMRILRGKGNGYFSNQSLQLARAFCEEVVAIGQTHALLPAIQAQALGELGNISSGFGYAEKGIEYYQRALAMQDDLGIPRDRGMLLHYLTSTFISFGLYEEALQSSREAIIYFERAGDHNMIYWARPFVAEALRNTGRPEEAVRELEISLQDIDRYLHDRETGYLLQELGNCYRALEQWPAAIKTYQETVDKLSGFGSLNDLISAKSALAHALFEGEELAEAAEIIDPIVDQLEGADTTGWVYLTEIYLNCYLVLQAIGDDRAARMLAAGKGAIDDTLAKIKTERIQRAVTQQIPENRRLLSLSAQTNSPI